MPWKPITQHHAIERVRVSLNFKTHLSEKMVTNLSRLVEELPAEDRLGDREKSIHQGMQIVVGPQGQQVTNSTMNGFMFRRKSDLGAVVEALIIAPDRFSYEVAQYTRWTNFLDRYWTISADVLGRLADDADIQAFSLEYQDRFNFSGKVQDARPSTLLAPDILRALPASVQTSSDMWHIHRGWFETFGNTKFLVNQNLDAQNGQPMTPDAKEFRSASVATIVTDTNMSEVKSAEGFRDELSQMHDLSTKVVREALCEDIQKEIGL